MRDYTEYLLIPYEHQGRTFLGADCFGLVRLYFNKELNIDLDDFTEDYPQEWWRDPDNNYFLKLYRQYGFKQVKNIQPNDLILFKNTTSSVGHVGIVLDDSSFMHMARSGCGIANYLYGVWQRQIHSVYRLKKTRKTK